MKKIEKFSKESVKKVREVPFWKDAGYTVEEWKHRCWFETKYSQSDVYNCYMSDFDEIELLQ